LIKECISWRDTIMHLCKQEGVKAGMVHVWVAGKAVWSPCYTRTISEREMHHDKALYKFTLVYIILSNQPALFIATIDTLPWKITLLLCTKMFIYKYTCQTTTGTYSHLVESVIIPKTKTCWNCWMHRS